MKSKNTQNGKNSCSGLLRKAGASGAGLSFFGQRAVLCLALITGLLLASLLVYAQPVAAQPSDDTSPKSCEDTYARKPAEIEACQKGADKADDSNYCQDTYTDDKKAEQEACKYGQTTKPPEKKSSCQVDGIGWIICPVVTFLGKVVDQSYKILQNLLNVKPLSFSSDPNDPGSGLYSAWKIMRDFANVVFIIGFLFIVFSQVTSLGANNYNIKKMLPKLIIAAILVNVSYVICALAVDLSNITGNSLKGVLESVADKVVSPGYDTFFGKVTNGGITNEGIGWSGMGAMILAGTAIGAELYLGLSIFLPILFAAIAAIIVILIVLTLRQALIILLIAISPLAFVALLLPNTEDYFKKWRALFTAMLIMYPVIALIFGGSKLASKIIMASDNDQFAIQMMGAGVSVIPLFITPVVMKAAGGVLNRFAGIVNDPNKGLIDRARKGAEGRRDDLMKIRDTAALNTNRKGWVPGAARIRRNAQQKAIRSQHERNYNRAETGYIADASLDKEVSKAQQALGWVGEKTGHENLGNKTKGDQLLDQMAQGGGDAARNAALNQAVIMQQKLEDEEVAAAHALVDQISPKNIMLELDKAGRSPATTAAILERLVAVADTEDIEAVVDRYGGGGKQTVVTRSLANALRQNGPRFLKAGDFDNIARGQRDGVVPFKNMALRNIAENVMSEEKMVGESRSNLNYAYKIATEAALAGDTKAVDNLQTTAKQLIRNENLRGSIKHNKPEIETIAGEPIPDLTVPAPPSTPTSPSTPTVVIPRSTPAPPAPAGPPPSGFQQAPPNFPPGFVVPIPHPPRNIRPQAGGQNNNPQNPTPPSP